MEYDFQKQLVAVWEKAVKLYSEGNRDSSSFPIEEDLPFLSSIGMNKMMCLILWKIGFVRENPIWLLSYDPRAKKRLFLGIPE